MDKLHYFGCGDDAFLRKGCAESCFRKWETEEWESARCGSAL